MQWRNCCWTRVDNVQGPLALRGPNTKGPQTSQRPQAFQGPPSIPEKFNSSSAKLFTHKFVWFFVISIKHLNLLEFFNHIQPICRKMYILAFEGVIIFHLSLTLSRPGVGQTSAPLRKSPGVSLVCFRMIRICV